LHLGRYSRLLVDLNRREDNPAVILGETYGIEVPGNASLSDAEREARLERWHRPYRESARADAMALAAAGGCFHLSIHSFDPAVDPPKRQFDVGVLFDTEREPESSLAGRLAEGLAASGLAVRLNEPYAGVPEGLTSWLRAQIPASDYSGIEIEASQGWMNEDGALDDFAERLAVAVSALLVRGS
jgi:predicted N-formylglutamate amidohydrolase